MSTLQPIEAKKAQAIGDTLVDPWEWEPVLLFENLVARVCALSSVYPHVLLPDFMPISNVHIIMSLYVVSKIWKESALENGGKQSLSSHLGLTWTETKEKERSKGKGMYYFLLQLEADMKGERVEVKGKSISMQEIKYGWHQHQMSGTKAMYPANRSIWVGLRAKTGFT